MAIGSPGIGGAIHKRVIRSTPNPLDKSTVVSIYPKKIDETKPTLQPGRYIVEAGSYEKPAILVIASACWWKELDDEQPALEVTVGSVQVADSFIRDYCNGLLACNMGDKMPGLFFVPGNIPLSEIMTKHRADLDKARTKQRAWFEDLVKLADIMWSRTNGNPLSISDDARLAATELGFKDKPWLKDYNTLQLTNCPACGVLRNNSFPVCQHCHNIIDMDAYKKLGLQVAK
jgi:hypothetical protein